MVTSENISPDGRARRKALGGAALAIGLLVTVGLLAMDAGPALRLVVFIPFWVAALGFLQARGGT